MYARSALASRTCAVQPQVTREQHREPRGFPVRTVTLVSAAAFQYIRFHSRVPVSDDDARVLRNFTY